MKKKLQRRWNTKLWLVLPLLCISLLTGCSGDGSQQGDIAASNSASSKTQVGSDGQARDNSQASAAGQPEAAVSGAEGDNSSDGMTSLEEMEVHFIDVGQGDATLVKCGDQSLLIDAAESDKGTAIQNYLNKQGIEKLDYLILTHPDADHIGGAPVIVTKFQIDHVFMSDFEKDNKTYQKLIQALDNKRIKASTPDVGSTFTLGSAVCTILAPNDTYQDPNNASVTVMIQNGENSFLFTGDAEEEAEKDILEAGFDIQADVYQAGHHGSRTSSCEEFLDAVAPQFVVISCGEGNSYGHPHAQTLNNLRTRGIGVYRTDEQGTLVAVSDGTQISWNAAPSDTWKAGEPTESGQGTQNNSRTSEAAASSQDTQNNTRTSEAPQEQNAPAEDTNTQKEADPVPESNQVSVTYVLNTNSMKFHKLSCSFLPTANRSDTDLSREEIIAQGYEPCKKCNP